MKKKRKQQLGLVIALVVSLAVGVLVFGGLIIHQLLLQTGVVKEASSRPQSPTQMVEATKQPTKEPTADPTKEPEFGAKLTFTGDLMVHDYQYNAVYDRATNTYDFSNNFTYVKKYLQDTDYLVGNLETTLGGPELGARSYPRFSTPDSFVEVLKEAGFKFLSTANNHCADQGTKSIERTIDVLEDMGFAHDGTFTSQEEKEQVCLQEVNGIKIAFVSCTYSTNALSYSHDYDVALLDDAFYEKIKRARQLADLVVALPHNGTEYASAPSQNYKDQYKKMLECGADLIVASHPHVLQQMEYQTITDENGNKRKCFIMYSMGNFISSQVTWPRDAGTILNVQVKKVGDQPVQIEEIDVIPTWCRWHNASGKTDFSVFSVYDILTMDASKRSGLIRSQDMDKVRRIQTASTKTMLGKEVAPDKAKKRYVFK